MVNQVDSVENFCQYMKQPTVIKVACSIGLIDSLPIINEGRELISECKELDND